MAESFGILIFPGAEELDFVGPREMLTLWSAHAGGPQNAVLVAQTATPVRCADCPPLDYLLVPGGQSMRVEVGNLVRSAASLLLVATNAALAGTHCTPAETVAFSCSVGGEKVVSLCLATTSTSGAAALSYRFGRPGAPELVFPASPAGSLPRFRYAHYFRSQVDRTEVSFSNAGAGYAVFDYYEGDQEKPGRARGVRVTVGGKDLELACKGPVVSQLPRLEPLLPCDAENALSSCR